MSIFGHGITAPESEIMDLWESGQSMNTIAATTKYGKAYIKAVVSRYHENGADRHRAAATKAASQELAAALAAYSGGVR